MCTTCGCQHEYALRAGGGARGPATIRAACEAGPPSPDARIAVEKDILFRNSLMAAKNRAFFLKRRIFALNLVSSPGSGKTELLCATVREAARRGLPAVVIEGDQETSLDAERIRQAGARSVQVNTGRGCHLDAAMIARALELLDPEPSSLCLIENVGNLVCPAGFDLGEAIKVVVLSVTEGEDKPLKYPDMFQAAGLMIVNKVDLLAHVRFSADQCEAYARRVNPGIRSIRLSALQGEGMPQWLAWLEAGLARRAGGLQP